MTKLPTTKPRKIQEIFDAVIDGGHYSLHLRIVSSSPFMCYALTYARQAKVITRAEEIKAQNIIWHYLCKLCGRGERLHSLESALHLNKLAWCFSTRLAIYRDWESRPRPYLKTRTKSS